VVEAAATVDEGWTEDDPTALVVVLGFDGGGGGGPQYPPGLATATAERAERSRAALKSCIVW
jgi:hypothetical protein